MARTGDRFSGGPTSTLSAKGAGSSPNNVPDEIPVKELGQYVGVRRFHLFFFCCMFIVTMQEWAAVLLVPFVVGDIQKEFALSDRVAGFLSTAVFCGSSIGVHCVGALCDRIGRWRATLMCTLSMVILTTLQLAVSTNSSGPAQLGCLWVLLGIPYGGLMVIVPAYFAEFASDESRGYMIGLCNISYNVGCILGIQFFRTFEGSLGWRILLTLLPLPCFLVGTLMLIFVPESPRWLLVRGRTDEATKALDSVFRSQPLWGDAYVGPPPKIYIHDQVQYGSQEPAEMAFAKEPRFLDAVGRYAFLVALCSFLYVTMAGSSNSIWCWERRLLDTAAGGRVPESVFQMAETAGIVGCVTASFGMDRIGRQPILIFGGVYAALQFLAYAVGVPRDVAICLWVGGTACSNALWTVLPVYIIESFPTMVRASLAGFCFVGGRLASIVMPSAFAPLVEKPPTAFVVVSIIQLVFSMGCFWIPSETMGRAVADT